MGDQKVELFAARIKSNFYRNVELFLKRVFFILVLLMNQHTGCLKKKVEMPFNLLPIGDK